MFMNTKSNRSLFGFSSSCSQEPTIRNRLGCSAMCARYKDLCWAALRYGLALDYLRILYVGNIEFRILVVFMYFKIEHLAQHNTHYILLGIFTKTFSWTGWKRIIVYDLIRKKTFPNRVLIPMEGIAQIAIKPVWNVVLLQQSLWVP